MFHEKYIETDYHAEVNERVIILIKDIPAPRQRLSKDSIKSWLINEITLNIEIEKQIRTKRNIDDIKVSNEGNQSRPFVDTEEGKESDGSYKVHFTPIKHDISKAFLTSFSFIAVIPIAWSPEWSFCAV